MRNGIINDCLAAADRCPRFGRFFGGCRFEARYSRPAFDAPTLKGDASAFLLAIERLRPIIYEGDVCVRCGKRAMKAQPGEGKP
jgi:hypothetical protein